MPKRCSFSHPFFIRPYWHIMVESVVNPGLDGFYLPIYSFHMVKRVLNISACVGYFLFFYHFESHLKRHFLFFPTFVDYDVSSVYIHVSQHFSCVWLRHCIEYLTEKTQGLVSYFECSFTSCCPRHIPRLLMFYKTSFYS